MSKSPDAFRTISEVADWLGIQAHVLRFWESKFTQVRPVKRAGGRRYYRPNDMLLLGGIKQLLHEDGLTIKGVQKVLREEGMSHVAALSMPLDELTQSQLDDTPEAGFVEAVEEPAEEKGVVLNFEAAPAKVEAAPEDAAPPEPKIEDTPDIEAPPTADAAPDVDDPLETEIEAGATPEPAAHTETSVTNAKADAPEQPTQDASPEPTEAAEPILESKEVVAPTLEATPSQEPAQAAPIAAEAEPVVTEPAVADEPMPEEPAGAELPAFLRRPSPEQPAATDNTPPDNTPPDAAPTEPARAPSVEEAEAPAPEVVAEPEPAKPKPRVIELAPFTPEHEIAASSAALTAVYRTRHLSAAQAKQIAPLLDKLTILRDSMAAHRKGATNTGPSSGPNA